MNLSPKHLIKILEENSFIFRRQNGSHKLFYNPVSKKNAIAPVHRNKDLKKETFFAILKQAGIKKVN